MRIYYRHITGVLEDCGTTDNPEKWLEDNNNRRYKDVVCCDEYENEHKEKICSCFEDINDFEFIYEGEYIFTNKENE